MPDARARPLPLGEALQAALERAPGSDWATRAPARVGKEIATARPFPAEPGGTDAALDALVIALEHAELVELAAVACAALKPGGLVAFLCPVETRGGRAALQQTVALFTRTPIRELEDICAALLAARITDLRVTSVAGVRGEVLVHGVRAHE